MKLRNLMAAASVFVLSQANAVPITIGFTGIVSDNPIYTSAGPTVPPFAGTKFTGTLELELDIRPYTVIANFDGESISVYERGACRFVGGGVCIEDSAPTFPVITRATMTGEFGTYTALPPLSGYYGSTSISQYGRAGLTQVPFYSAYYNISRYYDAVQENGSPRYFGNSFTLSASSSTDLFDGVLNLSKLINDPSKALLSFYESECYWVPYSGCSEALGSYSYSLAGKLTDLYYINGPDDLIGPSQEIYRYVPEPTTMWLMLAGAIGLVSRRKRVVAKRNIV